jgi:cytochrome c1
MRILFLFLIVFSAAASSVSAEGQPPEKWGFAGPLGKYDITSIQNGFDIYRKVCRRCEAFRFVEFRHLLDIGFTEEEIEALLMEYRLGISPDKPDYPGMDNIIPPIKEKSPREFNLPADFRPVKILKQGGPGELFLSIKRVGDTGLSDEDIVDLVHFVAWAEDPKMVRRKKTGLGVVIYLLIMAGVLFAVYKGNSPV